MRPRHLPGQQNVSEVERYQARVHVLWRPSTDTQHQTIGSMVNTVDAHLQLRHVKTGLLQRRSRRPAQLRPGPSAVLTVGAQRHDHITLLLADLHWLRIPQRIQYKLCILVYQCVQGSAPSYLQNAICLVTSAESESWRCLSFASSTDLIVPVM